MARETSSCPGCVAQFASIDGPVHPYMTSSPGCWRAFGELLAADYSSPARMAFHQVIVDAYAAQHPGVGEARQVQSVGLHLMTLCLFLEHGADPADGARLHRMMIRRPAFHRLRRCGPGTLTALHVPLCGDDELARRAAFEWAAAVWESYRQDRQTVREWLREANCLPA